MVSGLLILWSIQFEKRCSRKDILIDAESSVSILATWSRSCHDPDSGKSCPNPDFVWLHFQKSGSIRPTNIGIFHPLVQSIYYTSNVCMVQVQNLTVSNPSLLVNLCSKVERSSPLNTGPEWGPETSCHWSCIINQ